MSAASCPEGIVRVALADIVQEPLWQVRERINVSRVKEYRTAYRAGATLPPIELADINGGLFLVDGAHRLAALREAGYTEAEAVISKMTRTEAECRAAMANLFHGEALSKKERRTAFRKFIATKHHRKHGGKIMSYREMSAAFGGTVSHVTIRNWIEQDYPAIYTALSNGHSGTWEPPAADEQDSTAEDEKAFQKVQEALQQAAAHARTIACPELHRRSGEAARASAKAIAKRERYAVVPVPGAGEF